MSVRISSNATLFFTLFVPTFWLVFFGAFSLAVFIYDSEYYGNIPGTYMRWGSLLFYIGGAAFIYLTLLRLKRVEISTDHLYVTNYFRHRRYPLADVVSVKTRDYGLFKLGTAELKAAGTFGKKIRFLVSEKYLKAFSEAYPEISREIFTQ